MSKAYAHRQTSPPPETTSPLWGGRSAVARSVRRFGWGAATRVGSLAHTIGLALISVVIAAPLASSAPATPQTVDLELVLATDNSQSIDRSEALLQRQGVAAAFKHPDVVRAIQSGTYGRIAVAYVDWSSLPYSRLTLDWRIVSDKASADAFADALLRAPFYFGQGTAIGETMQLAAQMIETNAIEGTQKSIDISGDGPNNTGPPVYSVRDEIVAKRITINGLPVISTGEYGNGDWGMYYGKLEDYYVNCIIGGPRAFAIPAKGFEEFAQAVRRKLVLEISDASPNARVIPAASAPLAPQPPTLRPAPGANRGAENCGGRLRFF